MLIFMAGNKKWLDSVAAAALEEDDEEYDMLMVEWIIPFLFITYNKKY